jgi:hypothetical protein
MPRVWVIGILLALAVPSVAQADAGLPMLALVWPRFCILLLPIIALEAMVARCVLAVTWRDALWLSGKANLASTLAGIPLTWIVLLAVEMAAGGVLIGILNLTNQADLPSWATVLLAPLMAAWIGPPGEGQNWMILAAAMWLCVFFFLASVWLEGRVAMRGSNLASSAIQQWSWEANVLSYSMIEAVLGGWLLWMLIVR